MERVVAEFQQHTATLAGQLAGQYRDLGVKGEHGDRPGQATMGEANER